MRLLLDENFNHIILKGLKRRVPDLDYTIAQNTPLKGSKDPPLLSAAAEQGRILLTHDVDTIPKYAYDRVRGGLLMPGVIVVPMLLDIGKAIEDLHLIVECSDQSEYENRVVHLPLN
jgi:Domain of unknown function (DUF5615)